MVQEIGETRNAMAQDLVTKVAKLADDMSNDKEPFYIVFHAKKHQFIDKAIVTALKMYRFVPAGILGILVWYVDHSKGVFEFRPELSSPPDIPVNEALLSDKKEDFIPRIANQGKILQVVN